MVKGIIPFAHQLLKDSILPGDTVIDATCGNGNDTLFLSKLVGETGHVYAFDIQKQAIQTTKNILQEHKQHHISLIHDSHANMEQYLPSILKNQLAGAIFNLGYLPRSDKQIITQSESTISAIETLLQFIKRKAIIVIVVYYGHEGGVAEKGAVLQYTSQLDQQQFTVLKYQFINQINNPPFVIAIQKN